ncbi:hypothetical protein Salat_0644300 [Sesamum alatum]|uniref:Uncharacterized protein n=1 Tax=Sesamum alatum TaxID=300844 RepID=A0AAE1YRB4_9LAMI|nr:hypothetical protein Salat_0644300 [Sesamum alatum]
MCAEIQLRKENISCDVNSECKILKVVNHINSNGAMPNVNVSVAKQFCIDRNASLNCNPDPHANHFGDIHVDHECHEEENTKFNEVDDPHWIKVGNAFMMLDRITKDGEFFEEKSSPISTVDLSDDSGDYLQNCCQDRGKSDSDIELMEDNQLCIALCMSQPQCIKILGPPCPLNLNPMDTEAGELFLKRISITK